jgi:hypothetical protein
MMWPGPKDKDQRWTAARRQQIVPSSLQKVLTLPHTPYCKLLAFRVLGSQ